VTEGNSEVSNGSLLSLDLQDALAKNIPIEVLKQPIKSQELYKISPLECLNAKTAFTTSNVSSKIISINKLNVTVVNYPANSTFI
jgi:hypothetical protein